MRASAKLLLLMGGFNPYRLPNTAARYSMDGAESDSTYLTDGSNRVMLIADRSGNSAVNGLVLNGVSGNYASAPDSAALNVGANFCLIWDGALFDWTPSAPQVLLSKWGAISAKRQYQLFISATGFPTVGVSADGGSVNVTTIAASLAPTISDFSRLAIRADYVGATASVTFYTGPTADGPWTQLGDVQTGTARTPFSSNAVVEVGSNDTGTGSLAQAIVHAARIINGTFIAGTLVFDADFTAQAKLATSFTESSSNAATVTINSSGDLGARISGAQDLVQLTTTKMPAFSTVSGKNIATFDGSNDYMSAPTAFFRAAGGGSMYAVSTRASDVVAEADVVRVETEAGPSRLLLAYRMLGASNTGISGGGRRLDADTFESVGSANYTSSRIVSSVVADWNSARLFLRQNSSSPVIDNSFQTAGLTSATGGVLIIGANTAGAAALNGTFCELLVRSVADSEALNLRINTFLMRQWNVS